MENGKKQYMKPSLKIHGDIKEITKAAATGAYSDTMGRHRSV